jgi:dipeptidyl aminopeptidase/acylaminoacyl peptidase
VPVWAFHGADDPVVPVAETHKMVDAVRASGGDAKLTIYPGVGHDSWTQTYENPELYEWFLEPAIPIMTNGFTP